MTLSCANSSPKDLEPSTAWPCRGRAERQGCLSQLWGQRGQRPGAQPQLVPLLSLPHKSPPAPAWVPWLLWAPSASWPCYSLAHEPPRAMPGLWGHSAQTTACFRVTSAVPVGVGQQGKGLENQPGRLFKQTRVISFGGGTEKGKKKIPPTVLLGSKRQSPSWVHLVVWQLWVCFKICCPGRDKGGWCGAWGGLRARGYSSC